MHSPRLQQFKISSHVGESDHVRHRQLRGAMLSDFRKDTTVPAPAKVVERLLSLKMRLANMAQTLENRSVAAYKETELGNEASVQRIQARVLLEM